MGGPTEDALLVAGGHLADASTSAGAIFTLALPLRVRRSRLTTPPSGLVVRTAEEGQELVNRQVHPTSTRVRLADLTKLHVAGLYSSLRLAKVGEVTIRPRRATDALAIALNTRSIPNSSA